MCVCSVYMCACIVSVCVSYMRVRICVYVCVCNILNTASLQGRRRSWITIDSFSLSVYCQDFPGKIVVFFSLPSLRFETNSSSP